MTTEITSQIASSAAGRTPNSSQVGNATQPVPSSIDARQTVAAAGKELPENPAVQSSGQLEKAVSDINKYVQNVNRELQFSFDDALPLGRAVIKVLNAETEEIIREIPSEEVLAIAQRISEQAAGDSELARVEGLILSAQA